MKDVSDRRKGQILAARRRLIAKHSRLPTESMIAVEVGCSQSEVSRAMRDLPEQSLAFPGFRRAAINGWTTRKLRQ